MPRRVEVGGDFGVTWEVVPLAKELSMNRFLRSLLVLLPLLPACANTKPDASGVRGETIQLAPGAAARIERMYGGELGRVLGRPPATPPVTPPPTVVEERELKRDLHMARRSGR